MEREQKLDCSNTPRKQGNGPTRSLGPRDRKRIDRRLRGWPHSRLRSIDRTSLRTLGPPHPRPRPSKYLFSRLQGQRDKTGHPRVENGPTATMKNSLDSPRQGQAWAKCTPPAEPAAPHGLPPAGRGVSLPLSRHDPSPTASHAAVLTQLGGESERDSENSHQGTLRTPVRGASENSHQKRLTESPFLHELLPWHFR